MRDKIKFTEMATEGLVRSDKELHAVFMIPSSKLKVKAQVRRQSKKKKNKWQGRSSARKIKIRKRRRKAGEKKY